jgi:nicotinamide mononucleotide adenylyltransferase
MIPEASVHGRFQPFHNEHLEYVVQAKRRCAFLWIGITRYDITLIDVNPLGRDREKPTNNPLTYFERISIIRQALVDAAVEAGTFGFVPFPIETPKRLPVFLPTHIPCFTTICEPWNEEKIAVLKQLGYEVIVLWNRPQKRVSGGVIRRDLIAGGSSWKSMVPAATATAIETLAIADRLRALHKGVGALPPNFPASRDL